MSFTYKTPIPIDHTKCGGSDSSNFTYPVIGTYARLKTVANGGRVQNANGYDIRPYADAAGTTALSYKLVSYNATTGFIEMWVKVPTLSHTADTPVYLLYGDAGLATDGSSTGAWDTHTLAAYNFGDGVTLSLADATSNALNLTNHGTWGAAAGKIGGGTALSDGSTQYFSSASLASPSSITVSFWNKVATGDPNIDWAFGFQGGGGPTSRIVTHAPFSDNNLYWDYGDSTAGSGRISTSYAAYLDAWTLVTLVYDSATGFHGIYLNGALVVSNTATVSNPGLTGFFINSSGGAQGKRQLDEFHIADVARSADWITAEYNSQNSPSTFYTVGSESSIGASPTSDFTTSLNQKVVTLTDASTAGTNPIASYDTDWGDASPHMTTASGSHTYAVGGQYTITHTVSDGTTPNSVSHTVITTTRHGYGLSRNPSGPAASATADVNDV